MFSRCIDFCKKAQSLALRMLEIASRKFNRLFVIKIRKDLHQWFAALLITA